jgi:hypothetical protein
MDDPQPLASEREFLPLTDSLASRIRWRACDYAALFSAELELMLSHGTALGFEPASGLPEIRSAIRLLNCEPGPCGSYVASSGAGNPEPSASRRSLRPQAREH